MQFNFFKWNKTRGKIHIFAWTFILYLTYRIARKPISVVKSVLHSNCSEMAINQGKILTESNRKFCSWAPFDKPNYGSLFGILDTTYLTAYSISMLTCGSLADRMHIRRFLAGGATLSGLTTILFGMGYFWDVHSYAYYLIIQFLSGVFQATGWPAVLTSMNNWFGKSRRGVLMGIWYSHGSVGNIAGSLLAGAFVDDSWGWSFILPGVLITGMGALTYFFMKPYPEEVGVFDKEPMELLKINDTFDDCVDRSTSTGNPLSNILQPMKPIRFQDALRIPGVIEYSLCLFCVKMVSYTFLFWLPSYIRDTSGLQASVSAGWSTIFDLGGIIGGLFAGHLIDRNASSAIVCVVLIALAIPFLNLFYILGVSHMGIGLLFLIGLCVNGPFCLIVTAVTSDLGTHSRIQDNKRALATVSGIINGCGSMGAALGPFFCGLLRPHGWQAVFIMLMAALVFGILMLIPRTLKEVKGCCCSGNLASLQEKAPLI